MSDISISDIFLVDMKRIVFDRLNKLENVVVKGKKTIEHVLF